MSDRVFTGDTLLIRGTGRTDFQNGDPRAQYHSLFEYLLKLPDETLVYPAHDYKGDTVSTIAEERQFNPRLQVESVDEYVALMNGLNLPSPKMMDVAVPANVKIGLSQSDLRDRGWSITPDAVSALSEGALLVDLRERRECERDGVLPRAVHVPYGVLEESLSQGGTLRRLARAAAGPLVFYCAFGERSAMATERAHALGFDDAVNLEGGIDAWKTGGHPVDPLLA
jgi:rhodanese-related sulfurtransferase